MPRIFKNAAEILKYPESVCILDFSLDAYRATTDPRLSAAIAEPPVGIYYKSTNTPVNTDRLPIYTLHRNEDGTYINKPITTFEEFMMTQTDVLNSKDTLLLPSSVMRNTKLKEKLFASKPAVSQMAIGLGISVALEYLNSLCSETRVAIGKFYQENYIKQEHHNLIHDGYVDIIYKNTLQQLSDFVGDDTWHWYFTKVINGTTLVVEKVMDFRIYNWWLNKFNEEESES